MKLPPALRLTRIAPLIGDTATTAESKPAAMKIKAPENLRIQRKIPMRTTVSRGKSKTVLPPIF